MSRVCVCQNPFFFLIFWIFFLHYIVSRKPKILFNWARYDYLARIKSEFWFSSTQNNKNHTTKRIRRFIASSPLTTHINWTEHFISQNPNWSKPKNKIISHFLPFTIQQLNKQPESKVTQKKKKRINKFEFVVFVFQHTIKKNLSWFESLLFHTFPPFSHHPNS